MCFDLNIHKLLKVIKQKCFEILSLNFAKKTFLKWIV
jgi:hypothetical protein